MRKLLEWRYVRGLGQLQILNRVSVSLLIVVPILAAVWPAVLAAVNRYNQAVYRARDALDLAADKLGQDIATYESVAGIAGENPRTNAARSEIESLKNNADSLKKHVAEYLKEFEPKAIHTTSLPTTWAIAFFASLSILFGRTVFQLFCPETVREWSLSQHVERQKDEFARAPSNSAIELALQILAHNRTSKHVRDLVDGEELHRSDLAQKMHQLDSDLWMLESDITQARAPVEAATNDLQRDLHREKLHELVEQQRSKQEQRLVLQQSDRGDHGPEFRRRMAIIEEGARYRYRIDSQWLPSLVALCMTLYIAGVGLILRIIWIQSKEVGSAAGWW